MGEAPDGAQSGIERAFRECYGQAVATLVRAFGDITRAEDAVQDAFAVASERWAEQGIPPNPAGWIVTTARNRAIDMLRREARGRELHQTIADTEVSPEVDYTLETLELAEPVPDDQLRLIFTCCHPALRPEHQVALTLRLLGGLGVEEVASAFLVSEAAMAKRLTRAKYKIKAANIPYRVPTAADLPDRLDAVLTVLYLIYNAGAATPARSSLRAESVRLARELMRLMPDEAEVAGLLALLLLNESRITARWAEGDVVLLRDQDRTLWNQELIKEGQQIVKACIRRGYPGPFQLQAAIQAVHSAAASLAATDWTQIVANYDQLMAGAPTPVVALNRAIAVAELKGPEEALREIDAIAGALDGYHLMHAARGEMLRRLGRVDEARAALERARRLATENADRRVLDRQLSEL